MPEPNEVTITVNRGTRPVLVTGDPVVVGAVLAALDGVLRGSERRVLRLAQPDTPEPAP